MPAIDTKHLTFADYLLLPSTTQRYDIIDMGKWLWRLHRHGNTKRLEGLALPVGTIFT